MSSYHRMGVLGLQFLPRLRGMRSPDPALGAGSAIFTEDFWNPGCYLWHCWLCFY